MHCSRIEYIQYGLGYTKHPDCTLAFVGYRELFEISDTVPLPMKKAVAFVDVGPTEDVTFVAVSCSEGGAASLGVTLN